MNSLMIYFNIYIVLFSFYTEFVCWFLDYLGNIFEDLGLVLPGHLSEMTDLFRAAASSILSTDATLFASASKDKDLRLVASVRAMCKLPHPS